jgi:hypothetical protein
MTKDGRLVAQANEYHLLKALHRFGALRTRDLAALAWQRWARKPPARPSFSPPLATPSSVRMAQRTLRRLREKRHVLTSTAPDGAVLYGLAEKGAQVLRNQGLPAATGKDKLRPASTGYYQHRCAANAVAISAIIQGCRVSTEFEIARGRWLGGQRGIAGKRPDVLVQSGGTLFWVEVENSRRNAPDYQRLLNWLGVVARDAFKPTASALLDGRYRWGKIVFACSTAFQAKLCSDLEQLGWKKNHIEGLLSFENALYTHVEPTFR